MTLIKKIRIKNNKKGKRVRVLPTKNKTKNVKTKSGGKKTIEGRKEHVAI